MYTIADRGKTLRALIDKPPPGECGLHVFARAFLPVTDPGTRFVASYATHAIAEFCEAFMACEFERAVGNGPPGCGKSRIVEVMMPVYHWARFNASESWLNVGYEGALVRDFADRKIALVESELFKATYPEIQLASKAPAKGAIKCTKGGIMYASSIGEPTIGKHPRWQIFGDMINPNQITNHGDDTQNAIRRALSFLSYTFTREKAYGPGQQQIVFAQRLHEMDPSGWILDRFPGIAHLALPLHYNPQAWFFTGWTKKLDRRTKAKELLYPISAGKIAEKRVALGADGFSAQFEQDPNTPEGGIIKRADLSYRYSEIPKLIVQGRARIIQSWDTTNGSKEATASRVSGQLWAMLNEWAYLLDEVEPDHMTFPETEAAIVKAQTKSDLWAKAQVILIENKASGTSVADNLRTARPGYHPPIWTQKIQTCEPGNTSYIQRMNPHLGRFQTGFVRLPTEAIAPWIGDWCKEMLQVPNGIFDDRWDSCSQALTYLYSGGIANYSAALKGLNALMKARGRRL